MKKTLVYIYCLLCGLACGKPTPTQTVTEYAFSADSAYAYIADQVDCGARIPGTDAHYHCAKYIETQLSRFGAIISIEQGQMPDYEGKMQPIYNIIGSYNPNQTNRILLCAHWDTRPWADQEEDYDLRRTPVTGANDGASGVGVLLEIARQLSLTDFNKGIDIIFFDAEDMGTPEFYTGKEREDTWCLGSQLWAQRYQANKKTRKHYQYGILLDMVGAPDAIFPKEYHSMQYANNYVEKVWRTAQSLGYGNQFVNTTCYPLTDDHYYINTLAGIPCIDIIHYNQHSGTGFAHYWHTTTDDMRNISKQTLEAVGKTVLSSVLSN
ncbi:MAG: M28 family peptidase [Paludibacter sp.]|nr:M28 family peptidase [Bacteroidales bacterium]MCM1069773.1 M28 family peptidase [Prevotella sp.]MCM1354495.1 M28 family peptidase [Bacteroides sp.]MCM1443298.1 M28 family peptidase [Muribaculum sp.]MCM1482422.1 M28 family peptidase [Paludibacter sp.]